MVILNGCFNKRLSFKIVSVNHYISYTWNWKDIFSRFSLHNSNPTDLMVSGSIMALKFCANLFFMFPETASVLERYSLAKKSGFHAVESAFLYDYPVEQVVQVKNDAGLKQILINVNPGDMSKGESGFAALPGKQEEFRNSLKQAVTYCKALDCKLIHIMSGKVPNPTEENDRVFEENLRWAEMLLRSEQMIGLIEPINKITVPDYYMNDYKKGLDVVKKIDSPHLKLQADLFHWQMMGVDLQSSIREAFPHIGHIQIAQAPNRNEPDTAGGVDYKEIFTLLETLKYDGWIGLEYKPIGDTAAGLKWVQNMGYSL